MASKVEGELGLKISGFQAALKTASAGMRAFGEHAAETAAKAGEQLRDIAKDTGSSKIANIIGLAGAGAAVTTFVGSVVETLKKGNDAFEDSERHVLEFSQILGDKTAGEAMELFVHHARAGTSSIEDLESAMKHFIESGLNVEQAKTKLLEFQKVSLATGESVDELAQKYQTAIAGGLDAGEGAARLLKSGPMLMLATEEKKKGETEKRAAAQSKLSLDTVFYGMNSPQAAKDKEALEAVDKEIKESVHDWVKAGNLTTAALDRILATATGPGGKFEKADVQSGETQAGKRAALAEAFDDDLIKVGEAMSKGLKPALDDLTAQMPKLEGYFVGLGTAASGSIAGLVKMGDFLNSVLGGVTNVGSEAYKTEYDLTHGGSKGAYEAAMNPMANLPKPGDKVISLEVLEEHAKLQTARLDQIAAQFNALASGGG